MAKRLWEAFGWPALPRCARHPVARFRQREHARPHPPPAPAAARSAPGGGGPCCPHEQRSELSRSPLPSLIYSPQSTKHDHGAAVGLLSNLLQAAAVAPPQACRPGGAAAQSPGSSVCRAAEWLQLPGRKRSGLAAGDGPPCAAAPAGRRRVREDCREALPWRAIDNSWLLLAHRKRGHFANPQP